MLWSSCEWLRRIPNILLPPINVYLSFKKLPYELRFLSELAPQRCTISVPIPLPVSLTRGGEIRGLPPPPLPTHPSVGPALPTPPEQLRPSPTLAPRGDGAASESHISSDDAFRRRQSMMTNVARRMTSAPRCLRRRRRRRRSISWAAAAIS